MPHSNKTVKFYWDIGSTNSYFALRLLVPLTEKYDAKIDYHPFNLGHVFKSNNYVLMDEPKAKMRNRLADLNRWRDRYKLPFSMPKNFPIKTSRALKGAIAMRHWGLEPEYINAIFTAYWENNEGSIGEYDTLAGIALDLGVRPTEFIERCEMAETRQALIDSTTEAQHAGVFGAPTMVVDEEIYWGKDRMDFIETHLQAD
jgi:2-hydroxychromene-2-carboxylate isomerase